MNGKPSGQNKLFEQFKQVRILAKVGAGFLSYQWASRKRAKMLK